MNRLVLVIMMMPLCLTVSHRTFGAEQDVRSMEFVAAEDMDEGAVMASTTYGVVQSINLADRTAQISGYIYDFGDPNDRLPVEVRMIDSNLGAFELLQPNMKVEIVYGETKEIRLVVRLQQLVDDASIEVY